MISAENLKKSYGQQLLFDEASFKVNPKERVGLVGRNGHGKTTLLRMIVGEESPDEGSIIIPRGYRIGYVRQHLAFTQDTVLQEGVLGLPESERTQSWKVEKILAGLGFSSDDMQRHPSEFSGGFQIRLNLAKVLVSEPDLLLLDEPTNYLDITSIRWIERFLLTWPRELLLITHDRSFMDRIITHSLGIHRQKLRKVEGNTDKYYAQIAQDEEIYEKTRLNDERKRKEVELFVTRFRAKARLAGLVQSRIKSLEKQDKKDKIEKLKTLDFAFRELPYSGKFPLTVKDLGFSYSQSPLIQDFSVTVGARDRICIVGKNGKGKTTLLRLLAQDMQAKTGELLWNKGTAYGYFEQTHISSLADSRSVEEEIMSAHADVDRQTARNICGAMMFEGDHALKKIAVLSGGEKSRVMLGKLLATPLNVLLLDEPTNHLDMESCDALIAALDCFEGAVIMVTHNEMFLHALAERLIVFDNQDISVFEGTYQDFLDKDGWGDGEDKQSASEAPAKNDTKINKKELRRIRSELITERSRITRPLEEGMAAAENHIESKEKELKKLHEQLQDATEEQDGKKVHSLSLKIQEIEDGIEEHFAQLEQLSEELETHKTYFEEKLQELELSTGENS